MNFYNTGYNLKNDGISSFKTCFDITLHDEEKEIINICAPVYKNRFSIEGKKN